MTNNELIARLNEIEEQKKRSLAYCEKRVNSAKSAYIKEHARFRTGDVIQAAGTHNGPRKYGTIIRIERIGVVLLSDGEKEQPAIIYYGSELFPDLTKCPTECLISILDNGKETISRLTKTPYVRYVFSGNGNELEFHSFIEAWRSGGNHKPCTIYGVRPNGNKNPLVSYSA